MPDDAQADLVSDALAGDEAAFTALVGPLLAHGYQLAIAILRDPQEAQDALQDASFTAWRQLRQLRDGGSFRSWFLRIVVNKCKVVRRSRWWSVVRVGDTDLIKQEAKDDSIRDLDLHRAIRRLQSDDRIAIFLYFYLDLPLDEVAQVLGLSGAAARSRLYRAVRKLRPGLQGQEVFQ